MNAVECVQSKWGDASTLHVNQWMSEKIKFISYIYIILGIISVSESQLKMKQFKIVIDLKVLPALFVYLEGTAAVSSLANKIHASVLIACASLTISVASCQSKFAVSCVRNF